MQMVTALAKYWKHTPPPQIQLKRIAQVLGITQEKVPERKIENIGQPIDENSIAELAQAVGGLWQGKPNDPMLDFLDL